MQSNPEASRPAIVKRPLTAKECRRSLVTAVFGAVVWTLLLFMDRHLGMQITRGLLAALYTGQSVFHANQLRRLRRGEVIEVPVPVERKEASQRATITTASIVTAFLVAANLYWFWVFAGDPGSTIFVAIVSALVWAPTLLVWQRILTGGANPSLRSKSRQIAPQGAPTVSALAAVPAVAAPVAGHWWTQNAVRDEVRQPIRIGGPSSDDR